jgi:Rrf2 family protein
MKLSFASLYAVQALASMAARDGDGYFTGSHITAKDRGIPEKFLLKLLGMLARAGILLSIKGPRGGFRLARPANKITLLEILEAVNGTLRGEAPKIGGKQTDALDNQLQAICQRITDLERQQLGKVRLSDLAGKVGKKS